VLGEHSGGVSGGAVVSREKSRCPACGSLSGVPIVQGYPDASLRAQAKRGEVVLGGCEITGFDPNRCCQACGHQWRRGRGEDDAERARGGEPGTVARADFSLDVDCNALASVVHVIRGWLSEDQLLADASLWQEFHELVVRVGADDARVPARGSWPGIVVIPAGILLEGLPAPPSPRLRLAIEGDRIRIGAGLTLRYRSRLVRDPWPRFVEGWDRMTLAEKLLVPSQFSAEEIRYSGLTTAVTEAESFLDDVLCGLEEVACYVADSHGFEACEITEAVKMLLEKALGHPLE